MESVPTVSVLLPVHNGEATLERAIISLLGQEMADFEILVVDDGSDDHTPDILRAWSNRDGRVKVASIPRSGLVRALNHGLSLIRSPYTARMDADDVCRPDRLGLQRVLLDREGGTGLVSCRVEYGGDREKNRGYAAYVDWTNSILRPEEIRLGVFRESPLAHPSVMFRTGLVREYGGYRDNGFPEDYELWLRWLERGVVMKKLEQTLLTWNDPPGRLSRTDPRYGPDRFYAVKAGYLARWLAENNPWHPEIVLMGAGRTTRKRADLLCEQGIEITAYMDIDPRKTGRMVNGRPVMHRKDMPGPDECFAVSYVASRDADKDIASFLTSRGFFPGRNFIIAA